MQLHVEKGGSTSEIFQQACWTGITEYRGFVGQKFTPDCHTKKGARNSEAENCEEF